MNAAQKNNQASNEPVPFTKEIADNILLISKHLNKIYQTMATKDELRGELSVMEKKLDEKIEAIGGMLNEKIETTAQRLDHKIEATAKMLNDKIDAIPEAVVSGKLKIDWKTAF